MTGSNINPQRPASFAISDILDLDRNASNSYDHSPSDHSLFANATPDLNPYTNLNRHWSSVTERKLNLK